MKNIEALIDNGGSISVGALDDIECVAAAADHHNTLAMLVRRNGETINALLMRLDRTIAKFNGTGETTDKVNKSEN